MSHQPIKLEKVRLRRTFSNFLTLEFLMYFVDFCSNIRECIHL